mmetsp:Transcript_27585/g.55695  ORF Transcript_27585/g.55695 Transcript_27585/m.55695 type:complete len:340 (-) Transcript_27585:423-1442(-)
MRGAWICRLQIGLSDRIDSSFFIIHHTSLVYSLPTMITLRTTARSFASAACRSNASGLTVRCQPAAAPASVLVRSAAAGRSQRGFVTVPKNDTTAPLPAAVATNLSLPLQFNCRAFTSDTDHKDVWDAYLVGSISADDLFAALDTNKKDLLSVQDIHNFLEIVGRSDVKEVAFDVLKRLGDEYELDSDEFNRWLCMSVDLRYINPALEGILDGVKDEDEDNTAKAPCQKAIDSRHGLQQLVWDTFLETGAHGPDLFSLVDLNRDGKLSVSEIVLFVDSVQAKRVDIAQLAKLKARGEDHELGEKDFMAWLTLATGVIHEGGEVGGGPVEDAGGEHSTTR